MTEQEWISLAIIAGFAGFFIGHHFGRWAEALRWRDKGRLDNHTRMASGGKLYTVKLDK